MLNNANLRDPVLINTIGHTAGLLLFGLIIVLLIRDWHGNGIRQARLSLMAAALAFSWNMGSLLALASHDSTSLLIGIVMAGNFAVLSLLPAVLLQVVLKGRQRAIVAAGYGVSGCAVALHIGELFSPSIGLHQAGLVAMAFGFGALTGAVFLARRNRRLAEPGETAELLSLACLFLFTTSFLHFGYGHASSPWTIEIAWHHIGIPVALIVLLQDYRFLLLDTFVRFLINSALAAAYVASVLLLSQRLQLWSVAGANMFLTGLALVGLCLSLIVFAYIRNSLQSWVAWVVFRRQDVGGCTGRIRARGASAKSEDELFACASQEVASHFGTRQVAIVAERKEAYRPERPSILFGGEIVREHPQESFWAEAQAPLHFSSGETRLLLVGARRGRRRYLSEDVEDMQTLASVIVEQVERFRAEELKRLASQAELRALQAQINPHFLFNALNTLYGTIDRGSFEARRIVLNLADIFRYVLQGDRAFIPLSEEVRIVEAYLEIEVLRLGPRLQTELIIDESVRSVPIPILAVQTLVENAVKHGIAAKQGPGRVCVKAQRTALGLRISVEDTGPGFEQVRPKADSRPSVGLNNVSQRLTLCYGASAQLNFQSNSTGAVVTFVIPMEPEASRASAQMEVRA